MQKAIIGKKIGMTQIFDEKGIMIPVTVVEPDDITSIGFSSSPKSDWRKF